MPTYEYYCRSESCQHEFETFQSMRDDPLQDCPACGQPTLKRKIGTGAGIIFKGSGFYETDYKRASEKKSGDSKPGASASAAESKPKAESAKNADTPAKTTAAKEG